MTPWAGRRLGWFVLMEHILCWPEPFWSLNAANQHPVESRLYSLSNADQSIERKVSSDQWCFSLRWADMIGV